ncbi:MAG: hypothetical protein WC880_00345 [Candidatus Paceibacterota bacterium]
MSEKRFPPTKGDSGRSFHEESVTRQCLSIDCSKDVPLYVLMFTGGTCLGCRTA